jgi:raffinose/stachyose/melibiose transport system substrate-binding protein
MGVYMKRFFFRAASALLCAGLIAAPVFANGQKQDAAASQAKQKIVIFQSKVEITKQLEQAASTYMQSHPGVDVEVWETTGDSYLQNLRTKLATHQGPSLYSVAPGAEADELSKYMADLSDLSFIKDINPSLLTMENGKPTGIPYTMEGFGMVYNKSLVDPSKVHDYDSFVAFLKDCKAKGINGFGLSQESYFLIGHILNWPFAVMPDYAAFMDKLNKGQEKMADTPSFQEWAKFMEAIRQYSYNPLEETYDQECGDFATGKTAAIHQGNWCYSEFKDFLPSMKFQMGLMPFPLQGNDKLAVSVPTVWAVNSQKSIAEQSLAKDFLTWLYTSTAGKAYLTEQFGFIPVVKGTVSTKLDPLSADVQKYAEAGKTIGWATNLYPGGGGSVQNYLLPAAQQFFAPNSKMTGQQLLEALDAAWAKMNNR